MLNQIQSLNLMFKCELTAPYLQSQAYQPQSTKASLPLPPEPLSVFPPDYDDDDDDRQYNDHDGDDDKDGDCYKQR